MKHCRLSETIGAGSEVSSSGFSIGIEDATALRGGASRSLLQEGKGALEDTTGLPGGGFMFAAMGSLRVQPQAEPQRFAATLPVDLAITARIRS